MAALSRSFRVIFLVTLRNVGLLYWLQAPLGTVGRLLVEVFDIAEERVGYWIETEALFISKVNSNSVGDRAQ